MTTNKKPKLVGSSPVPVSDQDDPSPSPQASVSQPAEPAGSPDILKSLRARFGGLSAKPPSRQRNLKTLFYGPAGVGKTTLYGSAQKVKSMKDLLVLDIEGGTMSLAHDPTIDVVQMDTYAKFARMAEWARLYCKARDAKDRRRMVLLEQAIKPQVDPKEIEESPKVYRSIAIDSLTEAHKLCMYQLLGIEIGDRALDEEPDNAEFKQWGQAAEMLRLLVRTYRSLPMNVFFVCGLSEEQDELKRYHQQPALSGKLAKEIHGFVDVVGYMAARERVMDIETPEGVKKARSIERRLYLQPGETFQAKDRYHTGNSVRFLVNPTLQDFLDAE